MRFLVPSVLALLAVVLAWARTSSARFRLLALLGLAVQVPAVALGPHTSLMAQHQQRASKVYVSLGGTSPMTIDDSRFHPRYSQVTATWELFLDKLGRPIPRSPDPVLTGSTWSEGLGDFEPPPWDVFWLRQRGPVG